MKALTRADLVTYIEETRGPDVCPVFHLADVLTMYAIRLARMGVLMDTRPNSTGLKEMLSKMVPGLKAHSEGKRVADVCERLGRRDNECMQPKR